MRGKRLLALLLTGILIVQPGMVFAADVVVSDTADDAVIAAQMDAVSRIEDDIEIEEQDAEAVTDEENTAADVAEEPVDSEGVQSITVDDSAAAANGTCGSLTWSLDANGLLTVSGSGEIPNYVTVKDWYTDEVLEENKAPWADFRNQIKEIVIGEGVTTIGYAAFSNCRSLKKVTIAATVTCIKENAFVNATALTEVVGGSGIKKMESSVFYGARMTSLTLSKNLTELDPEALQGLNKLQNIYVEQGNKAYQSRDGVLFTGNGKTICHVPAGRTGSYIIPSGVTTIGESAFSQSALSSIGIPNSVTEIGDTAFYRCKNLKTITLPASVIRVGESAFPSTTKVICENPNLYVIGESFVNGIQIKITAKESYKKAFEILQLVNRERASAGAAPLTMDVDLMEAAMQRAAEITLNFSHTRPSGVDCFSACDKMYGENIAYGSNTASGVMNSWMNSSGHKTNILNSSYESIGVGCIYWNGKYYWVQCFGYDEAAAANASSYSDKTAARNVVVKKDPEYYKAALSLSKTGLTVGGSATASVTWNGKTLSDSGAVIKSSNTKVCTVSGGTIRAVGAGTAKIKMYFPGYEENTATKTITVKNKTTNHKHSYQTTTTKAKPTANGKTVTKCSICGYVKSTTTIYRPKTVTLSKTSFVYNKKVQKPTVTVKDSKGKKIASSNYTVKYSSGCKAVGSYQVTVTFKGSKYSGSLSKKFAIVPKAATLRSVTAAVKGFTVKWAKQTTQTTGYQIQYSASSKFTGAKTVLVAGNKTTSKKITGLSAKKKYYVRIRTYKTVNGKKLYSAWSKVKTVTTKK